MSFRVGDIVECTPAGGYYTGEEGSTWEISSISRDGEVLTCKKLTDGPRPYLSVGRTYSVYAHSFTVMKKKAVAPKGFAAFQRRIAA